MTSKKPLTGMEGVTTELPARQGNHLDEGTTIDWREMAERRLTKLTEAEHDLSVVRDRLDHLQSSYRLLLQQSEERLLRIRGLNHELEKLRAAHSQQRGTSRRWLAALRQRIKRIVLFMIGLVLRVPLVKPVAKRLLRISPKLNDKLRARLLASRQSE